MPKPFLQKEGSPFQHKTRFLIDPHSRFIYAVRPRCRARRLLSWIGRRWRQAFHGCLVLFGATDRWPGVGGRPMTFFPDDRSQASDPGLLPRSGRPARVLIAEDNATMRETLTSLVQDLGYDAVAVADGKAALAAVAHAAPDLILSDVAMPNMTGLEVCRRLKADPATRLIPVILITGLAEQYKIEGIEAGADDFLGKPFSPAELRARIRALLRLKAFTDELEHAEAVLYTLARSIEAKDPYTEGHCERLATCAVAVGRVLKLSEDELIALRRGGYLHDLGKVSVPEGILLKPGPLTPPQIDVMKQHPVVGEAICRPLRSLQMVLPIIRHHHERRDGSGYPDGLHGETIPVTARILQVVDVFDALTSDRPYRHAATLTTALDVLESEVRSGWWDPEIIRAFREVLNGSETRLGWRRGRTRSHRDQTEPGSIPPFLFR